MSSETSNTPKDQSDSTNIATLLGNLIGVGIAILIDVLSKTRR